MGTSSNKRAATSWARNTPGIGRQPGRTVLFVLMAMTLPLSADTHRSSIRNSLLLLIDTSGSMDSEIGNGNPEIKIAAARDAAIAAVDRALANNATEVAVLGFSGNCSSPISERLEFTTDVNQLTGFIRGLQAGGGTPMADAVLVANRFMQDHGTPGTHSQMIVLLADGDNDCGDVAQAMDQLRAAGVVFRHETVGFGIEPTSGAARDLRHIANASGGEYHHTTTATQLADVFMEFVDTFTVIDMLGMFGGNASNSTPSGRNTSANSAASTGQGAQARTSADDDKGGPTSLMGAFKTADADDDTVAALAIDTNQGAAWGWGADHATEAEAQRTAIGECGQECTVVVTFRDGCAAYAADQEPGSSAYGWASDHVTQPEATQAALDECARQGGTDCLVRVWACSDGHGGGRGNDASIADDRDGAGSAETPFGALAIESGPGMAWGLATGYPSQTEARSVAIEECGAGCEIVLTFEDGCVAYVADQAAGSTVRGWAAGHDSRAEAEQAALEECAKRDGTNCVIRDWDCS